METKINSQDFLNNFLLKRKDAVYIIGNEPPTTYKLQLITTGAKNLEELGYTLTGNLIGEMVKAKDEDIIKTFEFLESKLIDRLGGNVEYHPMYPNFPDSVMVSDEARLYFDALVYECSNFTILPPDPIINNDKEAAYIEEVKNTAPKFKRLKMIEYASADVLQTIATNLLSSPTAFSPEDKDDISNLMEIVDNFEQYCVPEKIPNRENLAWLAAEYMTKSEPSKNMFLDKMNSATDILRVMAERSGADSSLTQTFKFAPLKKKEINAYVNKLLSIDRKRAEQDISKHAEQFKAMNRTYHLRNYKNKDLQNLLDKLYDGTLEKTFSAKRDEYIKQGNFKELVDLYRENHGQMSADIGMLSLIAQKNGKEDEQYLSNAYARNTSKTKAETLLKADAFLAGRTEKSDYMIYSPKKGLVRSYLKQDNREPLNPELVKTLRTAIEKSLEEKYSKKRPLGKVYVDPELKNIKLPSQQRMDASGSAGMTYGSKFDLDEKAKDLRAFIWWTNSEQTDYVDIDLSAAIYDKEMNHLEDISYYNLKSEYGVHSGDIRDGGPVGGKGAAEFIDFDLNSLKNTGAAYVSFSVAVYSGENFKDTPCKFGWMESNEKLNGLFDITKVQKAIELNTLSSRSLPVLYDIKNNQMIWMDRTPKQGITCPVAINNNITHMTGDVVECLKAATSTAPDLKRLIDIQVASRGELTDDPKEANTVFTVDRVDKSNYPTASEFVSAYDTAEILGDLVSEELSQKDIEYFLCTKEVPEKAKSSIEETR